MPDGRISQDVTVAYKAGLLLPAVDMTLAAGAQNVNITAATLAANAGTAYVLPTASSSVLGGVKVDGASVTVSAGVLSAIGLVSSVAGRTGDVVLAVADVSGAAPAANPTFTGVVALPATTNGVTPTAGTNTTQIATTQFVTSAVSAATAGVASFNTRTGAVTLSSGDVTTALTYTPYNATNPTGYQTAAQVTASLSAAVAPYLTTAAAASTYQTALGFTPYNATNPTGYQTAANVTTALTPFALTSSVAALAPVQSVSSRTGSIVLTHSDLTDWAAATSGFGAGSTGVTNFGGVTGAVTLGSGLAMSGNTVNLTPSGGVASFNGRTSAVTLSSADVTTALAFTPYSNANTSGFQTAGQVATSISAAAYVLPVASTTVPGGIRTDGATVTMSAGVLSAIGPVASVAGRTGAVSLAVGDVAGAAPAANPSFSGVVSLPATTNAVTATAGTNTTTIATTQFVTSAVASATVGVSSFNARTGPVTLSSADVTGALAYTPYNVTNPSGYQTAAQVTASQSSALAPYITSASVTTALTSYAPLASPSLSGVPTAPTAAAGTNTTQLATTAFVTAKLNYLAPGAGAVSRTIASKLGDVTSVIDFGADPTGAVDSTAAFNAALTASVSVYIPPGTFKIAGTITMPTDGGSLTGAGINATKLTSTSTTAVMLTCVVALSELTVGGFTIQRSVTPGSGAGIAPVTINKMTIHDVRATGQWYGFQLGAVAAGTVIDCVAENNYSHGFVLQNSSTNNPLQWTLINCLSQNNNGWGYVVNGTVNSAATSIPLSPWVNCTTFANSGGGVSINGSSSAQVWDFAADGCWFGSDGYDEMYFNSYGGNHFVRNSYMELAGQTAGTGAAGATAASHTGNGIEISANNGDVHVIGCGIQSVSYDGILCSDSLFTLVSACAITNSGLASGSYAGVANNGTGYLTVTGSRIGSRQTGQTSQFGISVADGALLTATGNDLRANSLGAIAMTANYSSASISGNKGYISRYGGQGTMAGSTTSVVVTHNLTLTGAQTPIQLGVTWLSQLASGVQWWISAQTTTTFTVNVAAANASATYFAWTATTSAFN